MPAVLLATVLSESGLDGSAGAASAPAVVAGDAAVVGIAAGKCQCLVGMRATQESFSPEVPPAPALSQGFGGDKPDMLMGVAL